MNGKHLFTAVLFGAAVIAAFAAGLFWTPQDRQALPAERSSAEDFLFAPEVEQVIAQKLLLVEELLKDEAIIQAVRQANEEHANLTLGDIEELDMRWTKSEGVDAFVRPFLANETAFRLLQFQEDNPGFSEVFVTDEKGLNVGQTNKTTDYYQADEDWWQGAFAGGRGKSFHGPIEFDESSQVEAISLYAPVRDSGGNEVMGVAKAVVSLAAIKLEL